MTICLGDFIIYINHMFIIYPVMFFLILISFATIGGFIWICLTPGGDPVFSIPRIQHSRGKSDAG
jgi:hypothetical protein